jgi:hypothetical protein
MKQFFIDIIVCLILTLIISFVMNLINVPLQYQLAVYCGLVLAAISGIERRIK